MDAQHPFRRHSPALDPLDLTIPVMPWPSWLPWFQKQTGNRKYVDLMYKETSLWASYMPGKASPPNVGDYGRIDRETGEFEYQGSIYENAEILKEFPDLKEKKCQPVDGVALKQWVIMANTARKTDFTVAPTAGFAAVAEVSIDIEVVFKAEQRGAFLAMRQPRTTDLPKGIVLEKLSEIQLLRDPGVYLVTQVVVCPAYAMCLSDKDSSSVRVKFTGELPIPAAPGVTAGGTLGCGWQTERAGSSFQQACDAEGRYKFCPLLKLKRVCPPRRFRGAAKQGDDTWMDIVPPWAPLDEDGNEVEELTTQTKIATQTESGITAYLPKAVTTSLAVGLCAVGAVVVSKIFNGA